MLPMCARPIVLSATLRRWRQLRPPPPLRRISTPASRSNCWSARRPAAATTSTGAWWRATSAGTSRAIPTSCRRTCRAPAARARPASSPTSRPRTAPSSPTSCRARSSARCSIPRWRSCSIRPQVMYIGNVNNGVRVCVSGKHSKIKTFDDARKLKATFGGAAVEQFHPRLRLPAQEDHRRELGRGHRLQGHGRSRDRARTRRDRRVLRLRLGEPEIAEADLGPRQGRERPDPGRDRAARRAHQARRSAHHEVREGRNHPQSGRADPQPAGVPPLLHRAARHRAGDSLRSCARRSTPP